jgi:hypothetical protein
VYVVGVAHTPLTQTSPVAHPIPQWGFHQYW